MSTASTRLARLEAIGFRRCGEWILHGERPKVTLEAHASASKVLYAFVSGGDVVYVGKTTKTLKERLYGYQNPGSTQFTNIRGNAEILKALLAGKNVEVFALPDNGLLKYGGFLLDLAAGLEDSIINELKPAWNKRLGVDF